MNAAIRHQRASGAAILSVAADSAGGSVLRDLYQRAPCRILFPDAAPSEPLQAVLLTTTGGLTGGDRTDVAFQVGCNARATLTMQAAEKLYRALPDEPATDCRIALKVETGAWAEWLAQETILFNGARLRRVFCADLAVGSHMLAVESVVFGRLAMGEEFKTGFLHDAWRIRRAGRMIWADAMRLDGNVAERRGEPFGFGAATAHATVVYAGSNATAVLEPVRNLLDGAEEEAGVTLMEDLLLVRLLDGDARRLRSRVSDISGCIRHLAGGFSRELPRVWHC